MNVFILHAMGDFSKARKTSVDHSLCFRRYQPEHNYYYHDINAPIPDCVREFRFDAVILDTTVLCIRYYRPRDLFWSERKRYDFIAEWDAVKVALPQDDYDHSAILDRWLSEWKVDLVYSVVWPHRDAIYPHTQNTALVLEALTGYVNDTDVEVGPTGERWRGPRPIDLGYRAKFLPAQFGSFGQVKGRIAHRALEALEGEGLALDVSTDPNKVLLGDAWPRFLASCRFCLGSEGGSSILDPEGEVTDRVRWYIGEHPRATFEEVAEACLGSVDRHYVFSAVSPRLFEAAIAGCGQVLVRAPYLDRLEPFRHYLPIEEDAGGLRDLVPLLKDEERRQAMVDACYEALVATDQYRYSTQARRILTDVARRAAAKHLSSEGDEAFHRMVERAKGFSPPSLRPSSRPSRLTAGLGRILGWMRSS